MLYGIIYTRKAKEHRPEQKKMHEYNGSLRKALKLVAQFSEHHERAVLAVATGVRGRGPARVLATYENDHPRHEQ